MKQLFQYYRNGKLRMADVPAPAVKAGHIVVQNLASLVSVGTEKHMLELAKKNLLGKALARPDLLRQFIAKAQAEGPMEAWRQAMGRLDTPVPLGYSSAGAVVAVGPGVTGFAVGDRAACTGSGYAGHAEIVSVPTNLAVKIPDGVTCESAAFAALGGVGLQAVRMARASLGETVVVIGLGLLGQISVQLLRAAGCHVIGMDINPEKARLALEHGADSVATTYGQLSELTQQQTTGRGADSVIILAATPSGEPLERAAELCRERGRVVAAGLVGLDVPRKPFYDKELELVVSRGWGPGLYDLNYTERGIDYPLAYGRWTAQRNVEEFLSQLARGPLRVDHLITHSFPFERAAEAYALILEEKAPYIGVLLAYPQEDSSHLAEKTISLKAKEGLSPASPPSKGAINVGVVGAGLFATGTLLPLLKRAPGVRLHTVATTTGLTARHVAEKFGFAVCTTDNSKLLQDPDITTAFILTRHGSHALLATEALTYGKHVFVEKPLALNVSQLSHIVEALKGLNRQPLLMVGFNRRFSPYTRWLRQRLSSVAGPFAVHCTVNAGRVPQDSWIYDPDEGGGRILGEVCHFVDLTRHLTDSSPVQVFCTSLATKAGHPTDNVSLTLKMADGSLGTITYLSNGDKRYPRERIEVFGGGAVGVIENFRAASFTCKGKRQSIRSRFGVDRGHRSTLETFLASARSGGAAPVAFEDYVSTTAATFAAEESLKRGAPVYIDEIVDAL